MRRAFAAVVISVALVACGSAAQPDDSAIVQDYQTHQSQVEVTADGTVVQVLPDQAGSSGPHERFIIKLTSYDLTLLVEHNLSIGTRAPVAVGDHVTVHGEYIWNSQGGLIHFTHHDPEARHEGGFIEDNGTKYD
jgi:hypothetical protein